MNARLCGEAGCTNIHKAQGYCQPHYRAALRAGLIQMHPYIPDVRERMKANSVRDGECLRWTGAHKSGGYGCIWHEGRSRLVHRLAWTLENGPIPEGLMVDHKCHVTDCFNISHLRLVTNRENSEHRHGPNRQNRAGHLGVRKQKVGYSAVVYRDGKSHWVGTFSTVDEAAQAAAEKRNELFTHNDKDRLRSA